MSRSRTLMAGAVDGDLAEVLVAEPRVRDLQGRGGRGDDQLGAEGGVDPVGFQRHADGGVERRGDELPERIEVGETRAREGW
jgi:hypothetical protein